jgi:hypothetical protein
VKGLLKQIGRALLGILTDLLVEGRRQGRWSTDGSYEPPPPPRTMEKR